MSIVAQEIELAPLEPAPNGTPVLGAATLPFLKSVRVKVTVRVGQAETTVGELLEMKAGAVLALDQLVDQTLDVLVDQHVVARGTLVAIGDHFGIRLTEPPAISAATAAG